MGRSAWHSPSPGKSVQSLRRRGFRSGPGRLKVEYLRPILGRTSGCLSFLGYQVCQGLVGRCKVSFGRRLFASWLA